MRRVPAPYADEPSRVLCTVSGGDTHWLNPWAEADQLSALPIDERLDTWCRWPPELSGKANLVEQMLQS